MPGDIPMSGDIPMPGDIPSDAPPIPGDIPSDAPPLVTVPRPDDCPIGGEYTSPIDAVLDNGSAVENGSFPALARLFINLFLCFLIAFTSSASAIDLYFSLISALARARACASGDCFLRVSGMYTSTRCPPSPCFTFTNLEYPSLTECADMYINHIF